MLESKLNTESVLAGHGVGVSETLGVGSGVLGDGEEVLSLEVYAGALEREFALDVAGERVAERERFQAQERAVLDVIVGSFTLAVGVVDGGSRHVGCVVAVGKALAASRSWVPWLPVQRGKKSV